MKPALLAASHPVLSCDEARELESKLFGGDEAKEWEAMQRAGRAVAAAVLRDFEEIGGFPAAGRLLVLVGKGHNGGDALIAAQTVLEKFPSASAEVIFIFGERALRPLAVRAWRELAQLAGPRIVVGQVADLARPAGGRAYMHDLCLDGIFGFQFHPPAEPRVAKLIERVNALPVRLRAAVDLPSAELFCADFTYATGSVKTPVVGSLRSGRVRYLDLGFFDRVAGVADPGPGSPRPATNRVLTPAVLAPLAARRPSLSDKRTFGHVFVVAGSRSYPGAALMTVLAALRSGAGLVTAFVPESLVPAFAARAPEAMWVGWPETPGGGLALEGHHLLKEKLDRATALVLGPGLGREPETLTLAENIVKTSPVPLVLDADALQPAIVSAGKAARILTPHAGEYARIAEQAALWKASSRFPVTSVLKGPKTLILDQTGIAYSSFFGGPVLARGGSGDLLAGLIGGLLAQMPVDPLLAAARGVVWHGLAADALARAHGPVAVHTTQLLDFLPTALREL